MQKIQLVVTWNQKKSLRKNKEDSTKGAEDSDEDAEEGDEESEETGEGEEEKSRNLKGGEGEGGQSGNAEDKPNESITDKNFRNNEDKLHKDLDNWEREPAYIEFNSKEVKFKDLVLPYKRVMSEITSSFAQQDSPYCDTLANSREYTQKFFDFNKNIINYMAKEFDMRKSCRCIQKVNVCKNW